MEENHKLARQWAEHAKTLEVISPEIVAAAEYILEHTEPPTLADVEWDGEKYFMTGADYRLHEASQSENVVLLAREFDTHMIVVLRPQLGEVMLCAPGNLTPNGKRYELREITKPDHPEVLDSVEDYENAPEGTVISRPGGLPWTKDDELWRSPIFTDSSQSLALGWNQPFNILRWGPGGED